MANVLISLVSDQTIPNIRLIKEFQERVDKFIFITTPSMEKKGKVEAHLTALSISPRKTEKIVVNEFSIPELENTLLNQNFDDNDEYLINITGGTKPMSIVSMAFFSVFKSAKIFYIPIGEEVYRQVFPRTKKPEIPFLKKISLVEYLKAFNLQIQEKKYFPSKDIKIAINLLDQVIKLGDISKIDKIKHAKELEKPENRSYYSGNWFEELIFFKVKQRFNLNQNEIACNLKLQIKKSQNEYDVVFVYNGAIYIIECKAFSSNSTGLKKKIEDALYKISALDHDFGLKVKPIFITTANLSESKINNSLIERAKSLNVKLFQWKDLKNDNFLNQL